MLQPLGVVRFGDFALDCAQRRLLHAGEDRYLPPKTFELLVYLVQNRGRVIAKEELLDAIWPGVNVVENTLAQRIREVREALGEVNGAPFIKTIPRVGYQFIGQVVEDGNFPRTLVEVLPKSRKLTQALVTSLVIVAIAVAAGILVVIAAWRVNAPTVVSDHRLVSGFPASLRDPSLSPDGGTIAFVDDVNGRPQIWLKNLAGGEATQLTFLDATALGPTRWSPIGDQILFNHAGGIWSVSPLGGAPRQLIDRGKNPSLSADGKQLVYEGLGVPDGDRGIWMANVDGTNVRRVTERTYDLPATPALSPNGQSIVFFQTDGGPMGDFWVIPSAGGVPKRLTFDDTEAGTPTWMPDGRAILFSSERAGSRTLWRVAASGGEPEPVTSGAGDDSDPQVSADGRRLIYTNVRNSFSLELLDSTTGQKQTLIQSRSLISGPRFSPDGDRIALFHKVEAGLHVFTIATDGSDLRQITATPGERNIVPRWSARGDALFFSQVRPKDSLRKVSLPGGHSAEMLPWGWNTRAELDPREQAVVFVRDRQFVVRQLQSGREMVLERRLNNARWSRDGQMIFGTETVRVGLVNTWNIVRCAVAIGSCVTVTSGHGPVPAPDGQRLYFMRPGTAGTRWLWSSDLEGRDERGFGEIGPFRLPDVVFDISPQHHVVFPAFHAGRPEIWMAKLR